MDEFKDVKLISVSVHGPGLIHSTKPVVKLEDMKGLKVRGGTRVVNMMLEQLGAVPVGIPAPSIGEALSKGVVDATTLPWEVVPALKGEQMVHNHTSFASGKALYVGTFAMVMNKAAYAKLPADLKKVIDNNSGMYAATQFGRVTDEGDKRGRSLAEKAGNKIHELDAAETMRWVRAANGVRGVWYQQLEKQGLDGQMLVQQAVDLIAKYSKE